MRTKALLGAVFLVLVTLGGCLDRNSETPTTPAPTTWSLPADFVDPLIMGHDHANAKLHQLAYNMVEHDHHPLGGTNLKSSGAHAMDIQNGYLFVAAYGATVDVSGGLYIFDLKNPRKLQLVGQFNLPGNLGGDRSMEATDDGNWVVLGTETQSCAGHTNPFGPGIYLLDVRDKARPRVADYRPGSTHSLTIHRVGGEDYVYATYGLGNTESNNIFRIEKTGTPGPRLTGVGRVSLGHDSAAFDDPLLGKPILYAAGGTNYNQLIVYDISKPEAPQRIGLWELGSDEKFPRNYVHAVSMQIIEGRRILGLESENWGDRPSPVWVLDATDFDEILRIANWTNPGGKPANAGQAGGGTFNGQLTFSTHNPRLQEGILYVSHYHAGVWLLNISTIRQAAAPEILGYYLPHKDNGGFVPRSAEGAYPKPNSCGFDLDEIPIVFDLEVQDGIVYAADLHTGVYVLEYQAPS